MDLRYDRNPKYDKPLLKCEWCGDRHLLKIVRVFNEETKVCCRCQERIRRHDRGDFDWGHPWANPVKEWPAATRTRFHATGMDALQAAKAGEHVRSIIVPPEYWK